MTTKSADRRQGSERGTQGGPWAVTDYDGTALPGRWPTKDLAIGEGLCGRYLLSGYDVVKIRGTDGGQDERTARSGA